MWFGGGEKMAPVSQIAPYINSGVVTTIKILDQYKMTW